MIIRNSVFLMMLICPQLVCASLTPDVIKSIVEVDVPVIQGCYELFLTENPELAGRFTVLVDIAADGHVDHAIIDESTLQHTELEGCVLAVARAWLFPSPGTDVTIHYPFHFRPTTAQMNYAELVSDLNQTSGKITQPVDATHPSKYLVLGLVLVLFLAVGLILQAMR